MFVTLVLFTEWEVAISSHLFIWVNILRSPFRNLDPTIQYNIPLMLWVRYWVKFLNAIYKAMLECPSTLLVSTYVVVCERLSVMHKQVSGCTINLCSNSPVCPFLEFQTSLPPPPPTPHNENFRFELTKVYSGLPHPPNEKLQIWDDQNLLWFTPPNEKLQIWADQSLLWFTPPPKWKTSDLRWPKFTPVYPFPRKWKTSYLSWPKFNPVYPPTQIEKLQIWDAKSLLWLTPPSPPK